MSLILYIIDFNEESLFEVEEWALVAPNVVITDKSNTLLSLAKNTFWHFFYL